MSFRRTRVAAALLLAAPLTFLAAPAQAHDRLVASDPADGQVLTAPPSQVVLTFSNEVIDLSQAIHLTLPDGGQLTDLDVAVNGTTVTAALPTDLGGGQYGVAWRVVSSDGHPIDGTFGFTVDAPPAPTPTQEPTPTPTPSPEAAPTPEPTSTPAEPSDEAAGDTPAWPWLAGGAVLAAVAAVLAVRGRRRG